MGRNAPVSGGGVQPQIVGNAYYVATNGSALNSGAIASPWTLTFALAGAGGVIQPNDTVYVRQGVYVGQFTCALSGTANSYITFRRYPTERVILDGNVGTASGLLRILEVTGDYTKWWGLEILNSDPIRTSTQNGSNPTDMNGRSAKTLRNTGKFNKFWNLILHDCSNGIEDQAIGTAWGSEWWGCFVYNNGWDGLSDRGHGQGNYSQNASITKTFKDLVIWSNWDKDWQLDGTSDTQTKDFFLDGCVSGYTGQFQGASVPSVNITQNNADPTQCGNTTISNSHFWNKGATIGASPIGIGQLGSQGVGKTLAMSFTGNRVCGPSAGFDENIAWTVTGNKFSLGVAPLNGAKPMSVRRDTAQPYTDYTIDNNTYVGLGSDSPFFDVQVGGAATTRTFAGWQSTTGWDAHSTYTDGNSFTGSDIVVRAITSETGRGHLICWNWDGVASLNVDVSTLLNVGDLYVVHHMHDLLGTPITSGTYAGGTIAVAQTSMPAVPVPYGLASWPVPSMAPTAGVSGLNVFLLRKVVSTAMPNGTPATPTASAPAYNQVTVSWTTTTTNALGTVIEQQITNGWRVDGIAPAGAVTYTSTGLSESTSYTYRIREYTEAGQGTVTATVTQATPAQPVPADITTLVTALGGDSAVVAFYDPRVRLTVSNGTVSTWGDARGSSGFGPAMAQATAAKQLSYDAVNGLVQSNGTTQFMFSAASAVLDLNTGLTLVVVGRCFQATQKNIAFIQAAGNSSGMGFHSTGGASGSWKGHFSSDGEFAGTNVTDALLHTFFVDNNSTTGKFEAPSQASHTGAVTALAVGNREISIGALDAGSDVGSGFSQTDFAAVIVLTGQYSNAQRDSIAAWAAANHGASTL